MDVAVLIGRNVELFPKIPVCISTGSSSTPSYTDGHRSKQFKLLSCTRRWNHIDTANLHCPFDLYEEFILFLFQIHSILSAFMDAVTFNAFGYSIITPRSWYSDTIRRIRVMTFLLG
jgi:hypothetical protein